MNNVVLADAGLPSRIARLTAGITDDLMPRIKEAAYIPRPRGFLLKTQRL